METQVYAFYLRDQNDLQESSSGGAFTALSNVILEQQGTVIACNYHYDTHEMRFDTAKDVQLRNQMRGSKYIQANNMDLYTELERELRKKDDAPLLVVGTPCQIAGAKAWVNYKRTLNPGKVIYCDLLCHGVSSPQMWKAYIQSQEKKYQKRIEFVTFKGKNRGWLRPVAKAKLEHGKEIAIEDYAMLYKSNDFMRASCYHCKYASVRRDTDITIGDFWGIQKIDPSFVNLGGTSLILVHTAAGKWLFEKAAGAGRIRHSTIDECMQPNMKYPVKPSLRFQDIHRDYKKYGLPHIIEKYVCYGPGGKNIRRLRRKYFEMKYREN